MALQQRLDSLEQRHDALQAAITLEEAALSANDLNIKEMKKQRLRLNDQMLAIASYGYSYYEESDSTQH